MARNHIIAFKVTKREADLIRRCSEQEGKNQSDFLRAIVKQSLNISITLTRHGLRSNPDY